MGPQKKLWKNHPQADNIYSGGGQEKEWGNGESVLIIFKKRERDKRKNGKKGGKEGGRGPSGRCSTQAYKDRQTGTETPLRWKNLGGSRGSSAVVRLRIAGLRTPTSAFPEVRVSARHSGQHTWEPLSSAWGAFPGLEGADKGRFGKGWAVFTGKGERFLDKKGPSPPLPQGSAPPFFCTSILKVLLISGPRGNSRGG